MIFRFVIPTQKTSGEYISSPFGQSLLNLNCGVNDVDRPLSILERNTKGLTEIYKEFLTNNDVDDYVIVMHDDVEIHDQFLFKKLIKAHEQFDVVGIAGASSQNYIPNNRPIAWHLCLENPQDGRGFVSHFIPKDFSNFSSSYINSAYFGPTPSSVVFIDGLFMSFKVDKFKNHNLLLDDRFTFHFYDMQLCAELMRNKYTIGVWPIFCIHHGLGNFKDDPLWHTLETEFKNKYNNYRRII